MNSVNRFFSKIIFIGCLSFGLVSCSRNIYTSNTSLDALTQLPSEFKEKGDMSADLSLEVIDARNFSTYNPISSIENVYRFMAVNGLNFNYQAAISKNLAVGAAYKYNTIEFSKNHLIAPSLTLFKNIPTKNVEGNIAIDCQVGLQYKQGNSFSSVNREVYNGYLYFYGIDEGDSTSIIYGTFTSEFYPLGYYTIKQKYIRPYIQPSFAYEHPYFGIYFGGAFGVQRNLQYDVSLGEEFMDYLVDNDIYNPLTYYKNQKTVYMGEIFYAFAFGIDKFRFYFKNAFNLNSDRYQNRMISLNLGIRSTMNFKRKEPSLINNQAF